MLLCFATFLSCDAQAIDGVQARAGLPHVFAKIQHGEHLRIAYLGGSITAADGWRPQSLAWLRAQYPHSSFEEIDAAVSGTGSELGVFRLQSDVLRFKPDLIFVEFAVNDEDESPARIVRAMEGIVRQTWSSLPSADICFLYTINQRSLPTIEAGHNPKSVEAMERVATWYGIPSVNLGRSVAQSILAGKLVLTGPAPTSSEAPMVFSGDGTHPYAETGHRMYLHTLQQALELMQTQPGDLASHSLRAPLDSRNLSRAQETPFVEALHSSAWQPVALDDPTGQMSRSLPHVWAGRHAGDTVAFDFTGSVFGIYGVKGPDAAEFTVQLDNEPPLHQTLFDPYSTAGRYRCRAWISSDLSPGHHHVRITVLGPVLNKEKILRPGVAAANPEAYRNDTFALYLGAILTDGPPSSPTSEPGSKQ
ncbi:GDSL-like Lipase/Acylhydrolase family protein [Granulicella rosea]|uniref:GDSL-like Lipase/Acylhydrolase family protein n=1 Tax=Granulicella rosea TaxID=474952 RepID=A0A239ENJ1_9BACT|nr:SGNH/GDSL hydrolase family protein [Granulicella rosea]SNS46207.1 GDSL-like Lipase/Acylhydrolase family protein [Granulicella rosea]